MKAPNSYCMMCNKPYKKTGCSNKKCPCFEGKEDMAKSKPSTTKKSGNGSQKK